MVCGPTNHLSFRRQARDPEVVEEGKSLGEQRASLRPRRGSTSFSREILLTWRGFVRKDVRGHAVLSDLAYPYLMGGENRPIIQNRPTATTLLTLGMTMNSLLSLPQLLVEFPSSLQLEKHRHTAKWKEQGPLWRGHLTCRL